MPVNESSTFHTGDLFSLFREQGHNRRTKGAWESGIEARATGRSRRGYRGSSFDYRSAFQSGWEAADDLIRGGSRWKCGTCNMLHGAPAPPAEGRGSEEAKP